MERACCRFSVTVCLLIVLCFSCRPALAGDTPFIGEMMWVPYNFEPMGWASCDGRLLPIAIYEALFTVIGTQYGGDGIYNFALPDMRGRVMIGAGQGAGLSNYQLAQQGGEAAHALTVNEMPSHRHTLPASSGAATLANPQTGSSYASTGQTEIYAQNPTATLGSSAVGPAGLGQPHNNMMPYQTLNCIIAIDGIYPLQP